MVLGLGDTAGDVVATAESSVPTSADEWGSFIVDDMTDPLGDFATGTGGLASGPIFAAGGIRDSLGDLADHAETATGTDAESIADNLIPTSPTDIPGGGLLDDAMPDQPDAENQSLLPLAAVLGALAGLLALVWAVVS